MAPNVSARVVQRAAEESDGVQGIVTLLNLAYQRAALDHLDDALP